MKNLPLKKPVNVLSDESGSATPLAIGFSVIFIVLGGLAVDYNKAMGERTQLQMAADSAAHAAAYTWEFQDTNVSTQVAMATTTGMLPDVAFRDAMQASDIEYGYWNLDTGTFVVDPGFEEVYPDDKDTPLRSAVRAVAELEPERGNESRNILLSIIGQDTFTIRTSSIYASYYPPCLTEGFVADGIVDMQSNSNFTDGFCMHSNTYVSLNQNNFFEPGTVVSMPNLADLDIPEDGFEKNDGLQAALRQSKYRMRILRQLPMMFASLRNGSPLYADVASIDSDGTPTSDDVLYPLDLTGKGKGTKAGMTEDELTALLALMDANPDDDLLQAQFDDLLRYSSADTAKKTLGPLNFTPTNRIYRLECTGNGDITLNPGTYTDIALVTDCAIKFANGVVLDGVLIAAEGNVDASHVQMGLDDNCAPGGGSAIWTYGTFSAASGLQGYGAQILALNDILFTAQANGMEGVSFIAGGTIDGTSEGDLGYCENQGIEDFVEVPYFRMVN